MEKSPKYRKSLDGTILDYMPSDASLSTDSPFELQLSLGDMDLQDAFRIELPPRYSKLTVGSLLNEVFPEDEANRQAMLESLDTRENPDLPDMYGELMDIFDQWRRMDCSLRFFANNGPEVELFHLVTEHISVRRSEGGQFVGLPALDLVMEHTYEVLARFVEWGGDKADLLLWLQTSVLLYFMDKHQFNLPLEPANELDRQLLPIAEELVSMKLIAFSAETGEYEITEQGRQHLGQMIDETESQIDHFDMFKDVLYDYDAQTIEFGTGQGQDLRVQVYETEGLDAIKAVFLLRLYDGTIDEYLGCWRDRIHNEEFFDDILRPVLDHQRADEDLIGWVIESGFAHNEEQAEQASERESRQDAIRRMRSE